MYSPPVQTDVHEQGTCQGVPKVQKVYFLLGLYFLKGKHHSWIDVSISSMVILIELVSNPGYKRGRLLQSGDCFINRNSPCAPDVCFY